MLIDLNGAKLAPLLLQAAPFNPKNPGGLTPDQQTQIALAAVNRYGSGLVPILAELVPIAFLAAIVLIVWLRIRSKQAVAKSREEFNRQLLDKFGSGREFGEFLESKGGAEFLAGLRAQTKESKDRVLSGVRTGVILTTLGLGLLGLAISRHPLAIPGVILLALGVGYLLSAAITHRLLNQKTQNGGTQDRGGQNKTPQQGAAPVS
jgi:hypothetical protein